MIKKHMENHNKIITKQYIENDNMILIEQMPKYHVHDNEDPGGMYISE